MPEAALAGKVVLVTGAGTGAGRALAEAFAAGGAILAVNDVSPVNVEQVAGAIVRRGGRAQAFVDDIAKKVAAQALVNRVVEQLGSIDILIHHATVSPSAGVLELDEWDWHRTLDANVTAAFLMMQSVGRVMRAGSGGMMLNVVTLVAGAESAPYAASVGALLALTRRAAAELASAGIRVHALGNGIGNFFRTDEGMPSSLVEAAMQLWSRPELSGLLLEVEVP